MVKCWGNLNVIERMYQFLHFTIRKISENVRVGGMVATYLVYFANLGYIKETELGIV